MACHLRVLPLIGMSVTKRLKELEEETRQLKQMYAELRLDHKLLKYIVEKTVKTAVQKGAVDYTQVGVFG